MTSENAGYRTALDDATVTVTSGRPGRERTSSKTFEDRYKAIDWAEAQERARLRKGFRLDAPPETVPVGSPFLQQACGKSYTGMLPVTATPSAILTTFHDDADLLISLDRGAAEPRLVARSRSLIRDLAPTGQGLLALADHVVCRVEASGDLVPLTSSPSQPCGVLAVAAGRALWFNDGRLELTDLATGTLEWRRAVAPELYDGHTDLLTVALSSTHLAFAARSGEVVIRSLADGTEVSLEGIDFPNRMAFWGDFLVVHDLYGKGLAPVGVYSTSTGEPAGWWLPPEGVANYRFAVSPGGSRLAVGSHCWVTCYRLGQPAAELTFRIDHAVRGAGLAWDGEDALLARVDAGFIAAYRVS